MTRRKEDAVRQSTIGRSRGEGLIGAPERGTALLWVAALAALALIGWMALSGRGGRPPADAGAAQVGRSAGPEVPEGVPGTGGPLEEPAPGPRTMGSIEARTAGQDGGYTRVFDGVGIIAGQVRMEDGSAPPQWTLHLEPSLVTRGRGEAVTRTVEAAPAEETFEVRDLPMGAYRVFATAPGHRSSAAEVALYKLEGLEHLPGMNYVNLTITLQAMANVDGIVRRANGDPADELAVHLLPHATAAPGERISARTDLAGVYRFDAVPEGNWMLCVGDPAAPLVRHVPSRSALARSNSTTCCSPPSPRSSSSSWTRRRDRSPTWMSWDTCEAPVAAPSADARVPRAGSAPTTSSPVRGASRRPTRRSATPGSATGFSRPRAWRSRRS